MRGGIVREHESYSDSDLEAEFGKTHILVLSVAVYTACPLDDPEAEPVRASSAAELARRLRAGAAW